MKEHIISFLPEHFLTPEIFRIEIAGITFPFSTYKVTREDSHIYSLEYIFSGKGVIQIDGVSYFPTEGDVYILPKNKNHHYWSDPKTPMHKIWFNVSGSLCDNLFHTYHLENQYLFKHIDVSASFYKLLAICENNSLSKEQRSKDSAIVFHEILQELFYLSMEKNELLLSETVVKAKQLFDDNLNKQLTIKEVASAVNLSQSQLTRQFKQQLNQTPYNYFLQKKIDMAKLLLSESFLTIKQISERLSFTDEHYFSNVFKKQTGYTPTTWRKKESIL